MSALKIPKLTFWRTITAIIFLAGIYACYLRFVQGWQASTNLTDTQPWGFWVGFSTLCGVGLSAGGFGLAAAVYLLGMERYRPILKASILLSFLGYTTVCMGMIYELGLPWRIWHPMIYWNPRSVLFDVALCVMTYTTVLTLEFSPSLVEKIPWKGVREFYLHWHHRALVALVLAGVLLSSMHQSFLGGLFLIAKGKVYPLWYSPYLTTMFYLSAIPAGIAMLIIALYLCVRSLNVKLEFGLLRDLSQVMGLLLAVYTVFRFLDLSRNHATQYFFVHRKETLYFWLEILLLIVVPLTLLSIKKVRNTPNLLYWTCASVVMGFMANRLNVSITAVDAMTGANYVPKWPELALTGAVITAAVVAFRLAVIYLDILPKYEQKKVRWVVSGDATAQA
ncbi:MAG TPA: NrfD/PsrC family molybdoenzyme membrane anchor subunit [Candidatus Nanoarchaeia archaeon]|nr:NrfD/PsrC family molybdoenzyme membrane anchor subunit [Candidatus Nanoarchaeia archaeon]